MLGGTSWVGPGDTAATLVRFLPNGSVDRSFGASGVVLYDSNPSDIDYFGPPVNFAARVEAQAWLARTSRMWTERLNSLDHYLKENP